VGSAEVFEKKLTALDLVIEWDALPETFAAHYEGYYDPNDPPLTGDFRADISVLQDKEWLTPITGEALFEDQDGRIVAARTLSVAAGLSGFEPRTIGTLEEWNPSTQNGFARLTLTPQDFSHGDFVNVLTRQTLAVGKLPDEMFGAQYKLSTYQFRVVESGEKLLFLSTENDFANEEAAQTAYDELLVQAEIRDRYEETNTGGFAPFGFTLKDAAGTEIATHPTTYIDDGARDDAIDDIIDKVTAGDVDPRFVVVTATIEVGTSNDVGTAPKGEVILPNEPYTPTIKSFHLNYEASINSEDDTDALTFIHLYPFGYLPAEIPTDDAVAEAKQAKDPSVVKPFLVPQFDDEGTLYLGIKGLEPLQSLSILFQVAESTADTDLEKAKVVWSYLADNAWVLFEDFEITADTTKELIASGIVTFSIPRGITSGNTRLLAINADEEALHWIKAAVEATVERNDAGEVTALALHAGAVSELIDAHTQAVKATFDDEGNDPDHLKTPLEAETIGGLVEDDANIDTVSQLYDSFGGRPAETGLTFYTRISERLRHKGRAITLFDYERLVLEQFPGIYKVKCINHTNDDHALAPGHVLIAVIPDFTQLKAVDARAPKVTFDTLDDIQTFLNEANCPFVAVVDPDHYLHVRNPIYEKVTVDFKVKFKPEITAIGFHKRKLNDAIIRFLSPWAFDEGDEINFGGIVYKSSILNFVEKQDYVDYVTDFLMRHKDAETDVDAIEAETPRSILIPAEEHPIAEIVEDDCVPEHAQTHAGIGHMTLHKDFEVSQP